MNEPELSSDVSACSIHAIDRFDSTHAFAKLALAEATRRTYASQWKGWLQYCEREGIPPVPASLDTVGNWIRQRALEGERVGKRKRPGRGQTITTLLIAVSAIKAVHVAQGARFDSTAPALKNMLKNLEREKAEAPAQTSTLDGGLILDLLKSLDGSLFECRDAAVIALGFMFPRQHNRLVGLDYQQLGAGEGWLTFDSHSLTVTLLEHKTAGERPPPLSIPRVSNQGLAMAVEKWVTAAGIRSREPIIRKVTKHGVVGCSRLGASGVSKIINTRLRQHFERQGDSPGEARLKADRYGGHSLLDTGVPNS